ncbi:tyrosine-type recombinase/integrase [Aureliella helgolandensis]|uniref:Phage integrase family protein n=1 Tax=Aureliella helgolandensis TaxID=2527968 RepID=A0A518G4J3_9BACT|nr:site-specific integrase [Aureliella helgolandensis]QDV23459.1 Phage integrase family protein [Aureliella helgolandensis]
MASLEFDGYGYRLRFSVPGKRFQRVRLGDCGPEAAERAKHHVEMAIRAHRRRQPLPVPTLDWLYQSAPRQLLSELAKLGVVDDRRLLGDALRAWVMTKLSLSAKRLEQVERVSDSLQGALGDVELDAITPESLTSWGERLSEEYAENTVAGYCGIAKQFFGWVVKERLLADSPAARLPSRFVRSERLMEVASDTVEQLCQAVAGDELDVALRLARWGGLRAAEILRVRLSDLNVSASELRVRDTKRGCVRIVPLFPELGTLKAIALRRRDDVTHTGRQGLLMPDLGARTTSAMAQRAARLCERLDIVPWPRFWQNMRATRESELMDQFALKDVCAWIGNSPAVAIEHYAMVRKTEFNRAIGKAS